MTQEDKELLLKDLCARLPYGLKIALKNNGTYHHENVAKKGDVTIDRLKGFNGRYFSIYHDNPLDWYWTDGEIEVEDIKPYLFPLSSMTESQNDSWRDAFMNDLAMSASINYPESEKYLAVSHAKSLEWLYKNHFDYRGLIEKGLALDATGLNIY